ncbi:hypothetical protein FJTKL_00623 [Diaporthe vaccinii]|uniref:DUF7918 domain-containing protein n=1 Tax=Diaporthe vaccinii TaxID=105482 RepID=A0ABR4F603_9PEZI
MAIIEKLGLEVKVKVNGSPAAEYPDEERDVDDDAGGRITNACHHYVESIDNAEFTIHFGLTPGFKTGHGWISRSRNHGLLFSVAFDGGHTVAKTVVHQRHNPQLLQGVYDRETRTLRKFLFTPVTTVDDANKKRVATDMEVARNLGLIRISVCRVICHNRLRHHNSSHHHLKLGKHNISLAEKALKGRAVSHGTVLSAPVQSPGRGFYHVDYVDTKACPLAVFYFKYRSKEALQQELIITRPRSLSMDSDLNNISPAEIHRLARERLSQMKDGKKRNVSVKDEDDAKVIKPERPFKYVRIGGGRKAIDLTEDD